MFVVNKSLPARGVSYDEKKNEWTLELVPEETDNMVNSLYKLRENVAKETGYDLVFVGWPHLYLKLDSDPRPGEKGRTNTNAVEAAQNRVISKASSSGSDEGPGSGMNTGEAGLGTPLPGRARTWTYHTGSHTRQPAAIFRFSNQEKLERAKAALIKECVLADCVPVLLEEELFRDYQDFCFTFLWPITHNVAMFMHSQANKTFNFQNRDWLAYKQ